MAWRRRPDNLPTQTIAPTVAQMNDVPPQETTFIGDALTAAASVIRAARQRVVPRTETWQAEVWRYYDELGEFRFAADWRAEVISRIRLRAAIQRPGQDEPEIVDKGPAADLVAAFGGGVGGQARMLETLTTLLDVPGVGWVVGEHLTGKELTWQVRSNEEIRSQGQRRSSRGQSVPNIQVIDDDESARLGSIRWRNVQGDDYVIVRVWRPHKRWRYLADSRARAARPTMRELELVNRKIQAQYLSRLASAGLIVFPTEVTLPSRPEFADAPDPFVMEWIETAREAIATPGTAAATVPIPIKVPGEYVDKVRFVDFTIAADERDIEKRDSAIKRLATQLDMPAEVLLGMGDVNHWSAWQLSEDGIKIHIMPTAELIFDALTTGYLTPSLADIGEDPEGWVVWGDTSEITLRPDRSQQATEAYDRFEISARAYRREIGMDEDDEPSDDELKSQVLKVLAKNPQVGFQALGELTGESTTAVTGTGGATPATTSPAASASATGPPDTRNAPPPAPGPDVGEQLRSRLVKVHPSSDPTFGGSMRDASITAHVVDIMLDRWWLRHPETCDPLSCEFNLHAVEHRGIRPGTTGTYDCMLTANGLTLGRRLHGSPNGFR